MQQLAKQRSLCHPQQVGADARTLDMDLECMCEVVSLAAWTLGLSAEEADEVLKEGCALYAKVSRRLGATPFPILAASRPTPDGQSQSQRLSQGLPQSPWHMGWGRDGGVGGSPGLSPRPSSRIQAQQAGRPPPKLALRMSPPPLRHSLRSGIRR